MIFSNKGTACGKCYIEKFNKKFYEVMNGNYIVDDGIIYRAARQKRKKLLLGFLS